MHTSPGEDAGDCLPHRTVAKKNVINETLKQAGAGKGDSRAFCPFRLGSTKITVSIIAASHPESNSFKSNDIGCNGKTSPSSSSNGKPELKPETFTVQQSVVPSP